MNSLNSSLHNDLSIGCELFWSRRHGDTLSVRVERYPRKRVGLINVVKLKIKFRGLNRISTQRVGWSLKGIRLAWSGAPLGRPVPRFGQKGHQSAPSWSVRTIRAQHDNLVYCKLYVISYNSDVTSIPSSSLGSITMNGLGVVDNCRSRFHIRSGQYRLIVNKNTCISVRTPLSDRYNFINKGLLTEEYVK